MNRDEFVDLQNVEILNEFKAILKVTASYMAVPLFLLFWGADLLYAPERKWLFLILRLSVLPICLITNFIASKAVTRKNAEFAASFYAIALSIIINIMIGLIADPGTSYYAGLNLIALGALSFLPFSNRFYFLTAFGIYLPYYIIVLSHASSVNHYYAIVINSFFIIGTLVACYVIRFFNEKSRSAEIKARCDLKEEIRSRDHIIRLKTEEGMRLKTLSSQFSPQIVESINSGKLSLETGSHYAEICVIFVDIVGSTEQVTQLEAHKVEKVIGKFLDDTIKILLLYDLTIDKFMGDGVIAFCNAPQKRPDFISRVIKAGLDVREKIDQDRNFYEKYWGKALEIRIGVATGPVNVGFYGSQKHFRNYTAIGPALAMAARLCSIADPGQVLVDLDVYEKVEQEFEIQFVGKRELKGFMNRLIHVYAVIQTLHSSNNKNLFVTDCPICLTSASLEPNPQNQLALYCKTCQRFIEKIELQ